MKANDFLLNEGGDMIIQNGDFLAGESDLQHQEDIINSYKGWYKEFPFVGVGIASYLKSAGMQQEVKTLIQLQLQADGFRVKEVTIGDLERMEIYIDAERNI